MSRELVVGLTGASGGAVGVGLLRALQRCAEVSRVHVVVSEAAEIVLAQELELPRGGAAALIARCLEGDARFTPWRNDQMAAPIASGSHRTSGMVIAPCSMHTLACVAQGLADRLIHRAADVTLKERRPLLLAVRETPLGAVHLENMTRVTRNGAVVFPICPAFYARPATLDDAIDNFIMRLLDHLGLPADRGVRWGESRSAT